MQIPHKAPLATLLTALICCIASHAGEIQPLTQSMVVEVINEVSILSGETLSARPAETEMLFKAPDFLETGRRSRARLEADDGTITRIGSNTLFSFDQNSRSINLKRGSLLFHSPEGKGGGRVVTASATASVLGTTIIVAATANGGFKLLVLEGTAQVSFSDGTIYILKAGQMTFVLPGEDNQASYTPTDDADDSDDAAKQDDTTSAGATPIKSVAGTNSSPVQTVPLEQDDSVLVDSTQSEVVITGKPGPVLNFDLSRMQEGSTLLSGFSEPLPSQTLIDLETEQQTTLIASGELESTDALIVNVEDTDTLILQITDTEIVTTNQNTTTATDPELERFQIAFQSTISPQVDGFPVQNFFDAPGVFIPANTIPGITQDTKNFMGFAAGNLLFSGGTLNLSPVRVNNNTTQPDYYFFGVKDLIQFSGNLSLTGFQNNSLVEFSSIGSLNFANSSGLTIIDTNSNYIGLSINLTPSTSLNNVNIRNDNGHIAFRSDGGGITLENNTQINAGASNLSPPAGIDIPSGSGNSVNLEGAFVAATASSINASNLINLFAKNQINLTNSTFSANRIEMATVSGNFQSLSLSASGTMHIGFYHNLPAGSKSTTHNLNINQSTISGDTVNVGAGALLDIRQSNISSNSNLNLNGNASLSLSQSGSLTGQFIELTSFGQISIENYSLNGGNTAPPTGSSQVNGVRIKAEEDINVSGSSALTGYEVELDSSIGNIDFSGTSVVINAQNRAELRADQQIRVDSSSVSANFIKLQANQILSNAASYSGTELRMEATDLINLQNLDLSGLTQVNIGARTLVLANINFSSSASNMLKSELGLLAPNPNSNATALTGYVNFINNVTVDTTLPAQNFVSTALGGSDSTGSGVIQITTF